MLFKSKINFPERFAFFYYLIKVLFGTAGKGIWNKRMDLGNGDLEHFVRFRKVRYFVIENVICFANVPHLFRICIAEGFYPVRIERLIRDF